MRTELSLLIYCASTFNLVVTVLPPRVILMAMTQGPAMMKCIVALYLSLFNFASVL